MDFGNFDIAFMDLTKCQNLFGRFNLSISIFIVDYFGFLTFRIALVEIIVYWEFLVSSHGVGNFPRISCLGTWENKLYDPRNIHYVWVKQPFSNVPRLINVTHKAKTIKNRPYIRTSIFTYRLFYGVKLP